MGWKDDPEPGLIAMALICLAALVILPVLAWRRRRPRTLERRLWDGVLKKIGRG